jgi:hypothetical protein
MLKRSHVLFFLSSDIITTITIFKSSLKCCCWTVELTLWSWPSLGTVLQNFPYRWSIPECSISIQIFAEKSFFDHRFQIWSYAQIVYLGLVVFRITSLRILHLWTLVLPNLAQPLNAKFCLTNWPSCQKNWKFWELWFLHFEILILMQCDYLESEYLVNLSFYRTCSTCWTSLRICD